MKRYLTLILPLAVAACTSTADYYIEEGERLDEEARNKKVARTFEAFTASYGYRTSRDVWHGAALQEYNPAGSRVEILLGVQRGRLYINDRIAMDFPVCTGEEGGNETPCGTFRISEKLEDYASNRYGSFVDENGDFVKEATWKDVPPPGTRFEGSPMPYWMRFNGAVGMHVGSRVERDALSHGCVRVPEEPCKILYEKLGIGSVVIVKK